MLLGSVIASTDAAAIFSILRSRGVAIVPRLRHLLELESGSNDPAAVFLTVGVIALIQASAAGVTDLIGLFVVQMGVGLVAGWVLARGIVALINRLHLEYDGLYPVLTVAALVAAVLMFLARPVAVLLTLVPFRVPFNEVAFVSWVGLRGATPIILATFPVVAGVQNAEIIFNVVFFVVLLSVLVQGTTIPAAARRLGVAVPTTAVERYSFDAVIRGDQGHGLRELTIRDAAPAVGRSIVSLGLPGGVLLALLYRDGQIIVPQGGTILAAGDRVLLLAEDEPFQTARDLLVGREAAERAE